MKSRLKTKSSYCEARNVVFDFIFSPAVVDFGPDIEDRSEYSTYHSRCDGITDINAV